MSFKDYWFKQDNLYTAKFMVSTEGLDTEFSVLNLALEGRINIPTRFWAIKTLFYWCLDKLKTKIIDIHIQYYANLQTGFDFHTSMHEHHAETSFNIAVLGFSISLTILDIRHWDSENNKFKD